MLIAWSMRRGYITSGKLFMTKKNKDTLKKAHMRLYDDGVMMICIPQLFELVFIVDLLHFVGRDELGNKVNEEPAGQVAKF